jgi:transposase
MPGVSKIISKDLFKKVEVALSESSKHGDVSRKLQAIKSVTTHGVTLVSKVFGVSRVSLFQWIKSFADKGIEGLKLQSGRGRKSLFTNEELSQIKNWIEADCNTTLKSLRIKIQEVFGKQVGISTLHNLMKKLNFSYITPRPTHYKQDKSQAVEFKKKSARD